MRGRTYVFVISSSDEYSVINRPVTSRTSKADFPTLFDPNKTSFNDSIVFLVDAERLNFFSAFETFFN